MNSHAIQEKGMDDLDLLKLELSLDASDLLAHAWYHGPISRPEAEEFLQCDGDFLVRDCSSPTHSGDFVLSCRWQARNLHFIIQRVILQPDTTYEKFGYRLEGEGFDTVPDLITYYVGSEKPISIDSGALISRPKPRKSPVVINSTATAATISQRSGRDSLASVPKSGDKTDPAPTSCGLDTTLKRLAARTKEKSLNLEPPSGLLESLTEIPARVSARIKSEPDAGASAGVLKERSLNMLESILTRPIPCLSDSAKPLPEAMMANFLETHERLIALHLTKLDCELLCGHSSVSHLYDLLFHNSEHRWTNIIEGSLTLSQFVVYSIVHSPDTNSEIIFDKWARVAGELKARIGNFFSFFAVMRGLLMPQLSAGKLDWLKLRSEFTESMLAFETAYRTSYQNLIKGVEPYPPNLTIPELSIPAMILEDSTGLIMAPTSQEDQLQFIMDHLNTLRAARKWEKAQAANMARNLSELDSTKVQSGPSLLEITEMFRTPVQLELISGREDQDH